MKKLIILFFLAFSIVAIGQQSVPRYELITASGTDTYTATLIPTPSLANGLKFEIKFTNANTGASTLNVNSTGAVTLRKHDGTALVSGDIAAGSVWWATYDGTASQWRLLGGGGGITSINSQTDASQIIASGTSGSDVNISSSGGTHTINIPTASGSVRGALSSSDWTTFNNKQSALSGTLNRVPYFATTSSLGSSGMSYSAATRSLRPLTSLIKIPGLNANLPPLEFYNHGYLTGTDTTVHPNDDLIRVTKGIVAINWSLNMVNNWQWDNVDARAEPIDTDIPMIGHELGGEGVLAHYTAPGSIPALSFHEITRFGQGMEGLSGHDPYAVSFPINQFKAPIVAIYASATTPPVATAEAWWGGSNLQFNGQQAPQFWAITEEAKATSADHYFNELWKSEGFGTWTAFNFSRANGTNASKAIVTTNAQQGSIGSKCYDGSTWQRTAAIDFVTRGTMSAGNIGQSIILRTSASNTAGLTNRMEINQSGNINTGSTGSVVYRTTNAGSDVNAHFVIDPAGSLTSGNAWAYNTTNGFVATLANGTRRIAGVGFNMVNTTTTAGSESADLGISTQSAGGGLTQRVHIGANGLTLTVRHKEQQGADVASVAGAITLGSDGNTFEITGTNAITLIANTNWQNGSQVTLLFTSTATLTDGTANSGSNIGVELAGNANFVASADDVVTLVLSEIGGTQRWREVSRSVN